MLYLFLSSREHLHREQGEQTETGVNLTWVAYIFFLNVFIIIILRQNLTLCSPFGQELVTLSRLFLWQGCLTLSTGIIGMHHQDWLIFSKNAFDLLSVKCWILLIVGLCLCLIYPTSKHGLLWILKYRILPGSCEESAGWTETGTPHKNQKDDEGKHVCSSDEFKTNVFRTSVSCVLFNSYLDPLPVDRTFSCY